MASTAHSIRAGRAFVELFADDTPLVRGLRRAERRLRDFGQRVQAAGLKVAGLGLAMLGGLAAAGKLFSTLGDHLAKMAKRTGLGAEALSELAYAASLSGTDIDTLEVGVRRMQKAIAGSRDEADGADNAFTELGLSARALAAQSPERQLTMLAEAFSRIADPTRRAALAMKIFGRGGTALLPLFRDGAAGMERLRQEARRLGLSLSGRDAAAAEALHDALDRLGRTVKMTAARIGAALAPVLTELANQLALAAGRASKWISQHRGLILSAAKLAAALLAAGLAIAALGALCAWAASLMGLLATVIAGAAAAFHALAAAIAFLVTPVGAALAALAALGVGLLHASGQGERALAWLGDRFSELAARARASFAGIGDALAAGDLGLAARVLWLALRQEWLRGTTALEHAWLDFRNAFLRIGFDAWSGLLAAVETVWHALEVGWIETVAFLGAAWTRFSAFFTQSWEHLKSAAAKAWVWIKGLFDDSTAESRAAAYGQIDRQREAAIARLQSDKDRALAAREAERQRRREEAETLHQGALDAIGQDALRRKAELERETARRMAENEAELGDARQAWEAALRQARAQREAADAPGGRPPGAPDLGAEFSDAAARVGARGAFVAQNVLGLQAGDATERIAGGIEQIERNTRPLRYADAVSFE